MFQGNTNPTTPAKTSLATAEADVAKELDDPSESCIYIPPIRPRRRLREDPNSGNGPNVLDEYDLRIQAYKAAWNKCLTRVQSILRAIQAPIVSEVATTVTGAYKDVLPGLPYHELPVVALHGASSSLVADIADRLERGLSPIEVHGSRDPPRGGSEKALQVHLYPADCSSVMSMMKGVVSGFVDRTPGSKRRPATALANFDINLLRAWYASQPIKLVLAVFLHEFEKFDAAVVQDVLMHVPHLPLTFVSLMASPAAPSYLHSAYPRSTLALLRVHPVVASSGTALIKDVLTKTFFDPDFEPDVMLGPTALEYIAEFATRYTASPDALITLLQLAHMKHFTQPLSVFVNAEQTAAGVSRLQTDPVPPSHASSIVQALQVRLLASASQTVPSRAGSSVSTPSSPRKADATVPSTSALHELRGYVSRAHTEFRRHARRLRVAFAVGSLAERIALGDAPASHAKSTESGGSSRLNGLEAFSAVLRGRVGSQVRYVCMAVRKLPLPKLRALFHALHALLWDASSAEVKRDEEAARVWIVTQLNELPPEPIPQSEPNVFGVAEDELPAVQDPAVKQLAAALGDWLQAYIEDHLTRLDDAPLWDIWYTSTTPFPSELVNPAPRPAAVAALLHPHDFARAHAELVRATAPTPATAFAFSAAPITAATPPDDVDTASDEGDPDPPLWRLPDTSIAFRRYVEAGRLVNVYDWFESFAVVIEAQRRALRRNARSVKTSGRGGSTDEDVDRDHAHAVDDEGEDANENGEDEDEAEEAEEAEEQWKLAVQARFVRALHELDYMGFVKHTGRKPDHVIRTIYDIPD
ncbi:hypothetical protein C8Q79DRAFT_1012390 [Trametes meyenii]|nr:hypothetical protein C8Q79DRAFT_1012390 [Trametes meyenii]